MQNFIIFLVFFFLVCNTSKANKYESPDSMYVKTNDGFKKLTLNVDEEGNVKAAKLTDLHYSFFYEASVVMTEFQKIPTFEDEALNQILGTPLPDVGKKLFKISEENFFEIGDKTKTFFLQGMFVLSSISDKESTFNYLESYGIGARKKISLWFDEERYLKLFLGGSVNKINNFISFEKNNETQKDTEWMAFLSIIPRTKDFFDLRIGSKIDDKNSTAFISLFSKMKFDRFSDELSLIIGGEISMRLESFKEKITEEEFKRYGSYIINIGMDKKLSHSVGAQFLFLYEENRKLGYKKEGISFKIYFAF